MKIRNGFVSNSSSSSFVVFGFKASKVLPESEDEQRKFIEEHGSDYVIKNLEKYGVEDTWHEFLYNYDFGIKNIKYLVIDGGDDLVGYIVADVSSDGDSLDEQEIDFEEVQEAIEKLKEKFNIKEKPKLYTGTRAS